MAWCRMHGTWDSGWSVRCPACVSGTSYGRGALPGIPASVMLTVPQHPAPPNVAPPVATGPWKPCCAGFHTFLWADHVYWDNERWRFSHSLFAASHCPFCGAELQPKPDGGEEGESRG